MLMCDIIKDKPRLEGIFVMILKRNREKGLKKRFLGWFFGFLVMFSSLFGLLPGTGEPVYAEPNVTPGASCEDSLGSLGWLVCPTTGKVSEAVDFLYDKIEDVLAVNPVEMKDGSPIFEIWKYFQSVTNILFIVFLLVVVLSQITGVGITNYGIKKALPKLIIAAVLVNLSFYICSLAVDVSNILGDGLRGIFESIANSVSVEGEAVSNEVALAQMYNALAGGTALTIGGAVIAFETGAIWMLIPLALGALVSVVIGLITIAMRQAVVTLLIMIAPLAMVAYILPNTEVWFRKWRHLLFQMLVFYPAFSLLFGASSIAGWAIIVSASNGFTVLIGVAVQVFPLFFSWSLMKMSGTFLSAINTKLNTLASGAVGGVRGWADSHRQLTRQKNLSSANAYTPSLRLQQFLSDRKITREEETKEHAETVNKRGLAYAVMRNYQKDGETPSREGEESYEAQARNAEYDRKVLRHKNNMNKGMGQLNALKKNGTLAQKARLNALDSANVQAFDKLKMEQARGERIDYKNAVGFHERMEDAMNAHMDAIHGTTVDADGRRIASSKYKQHFEPGSLAAVQAADRYADLSKIMEGDVVDTHYAVAAAAHAYDTQDKVMATTMQKYFELAPPTRDVMFRLDELTKANAAQNIDAIISGLRILNMRGDTDLVKEQMNNMLNSNLGGGINLGTHASQALASFLMFDVKDSDPWLRRFGKYINLETARVYNSNERKNLELTYDEYIKGYHMELDEATGEFVKMFAKKGLKELMEGTSLDNVERTAYASFDESLKEAYSYIGKDGQKHLDIDEYLRKREEVQKAVGPQFISASLKYLSGSEQLVNAVSFLTGYNHKTKKDSDGNLMLDKNGEPLYEWTANWEGDKSDFKDDPEKIRKYFNRKSLQYVTDQTPAQILGMRSDYYAPMLNHLAMAYEESKMENWTDEEIAEHEECIKEMADIQTRYGDLPKDEAERKRADDMAKLRDKMAGAQFRQLLDSKGKLNQIYRTRRSGAANNAKDWLRKWLDLDNELSITMKLDKDREKEKAEFRKAKTEREKARGDTPVEDEVPVNPLYTLEDRALFVNKVDDLWQNLRDEDDEVFYNESLEYIEEVLGKDSFIGAKYKEFRDDDPYADSHMLKEYLVDLLSDPGNY